MTDRNRRTLRAQILHYSRIVRIRSGHRRATGQQDAGDARHASTTDTNQVDS